MRRELTLPQRIAAVRRFNRFYTQKIGVLDEGLLDSPFSLTEVRVLYELAHRDEPTAAAIVRDLGLDAGYLSRILRRFQEHGLVEKRASSNDGRQCILRLTHKGRRAFEPINARTDAQVRSILAALSRAEQGCLLEALRTVEELLTGPAKAGPYKRDEAGPSTREQAGVHTNGASGGTARRRRRAGAARASTGR